MSCRDEYVVIGLNGTGRTLAGMLALGLSGNLILVDDDTVSEANFEQGYSDIDVGMLKTEAVKAAIGEITYNGNIQIFTNLDIAIEQLEGKIGNVVVFCCKPVSNKTRLHISKALSSASQYMYFCAYNDVGNYDIFSCGNEPVNIDVLNDLPSSKENISMAKSAASAMYVQHVVKSQQTII